MSRPNPESQYYARHKARPFSFLSRRIRSHLPFLIIIPLLIIVMTWPTFIHVFDTSTFWLHTGGNDRWYKIWEAWHLKRVLAGQADYYFTDTIFHPIGVSLAFHQITLPHAIVFAALQAIMPSDNAYNLCFLLMLLFNASGAYVLLLYLLNDRFASVFGASVFGLSPLLVGGPTLADLILVGTMPLAFYYLHRSVLERRWTYAAFAGLSIGITAFIGLYIYVCLIMSLAIFGVAMALSRWRETSFWLMIAVALGIGGIISSLRFYPMIDDRESLAYGLNKYDGMRDDSYDVVEYFVNTTNPLTYPTLRDILKLSPVRVMGNGYLGYVPLVLIVIGLLHRRYRRAMLPWLAIFAVFVVLKPGENLMVNGTLFDDFYLPKYHLQRFIPLLFDAVGRSARFQLGILLPLAILSGYGLLSLSRAQTPARRIALIGCCLALLSVEYYDPVPEVTLDKSKTAFLDWLATEDQAPIKLIHLPMRKDFNKYYMYLQTLNGYPLANGIINRTPPGAYAYLNANLILDAWVKRRNINCSVEDPAVFYSAVDLMQDDGYTHIVYHHQLAPSSLIFPGLSTMSPSYEDEHTRVFRLDDVRESCFDPDVLSHSELASYQRLAQMNDLLRTDLASIVSLHPFNPVDSTIFEGYSAGLAGWKDLIHIFHADNRTVIQQLNRKYYEVDDIASLNDALLIMYDPRNAKKYRQEVFRDSLNDAFRLCGRIVEADDAIIEYHVKPDIPCQLLLARPPLRVSFDSEVNLHNLIWELDGGQLDVYALWRQSKLVMHAFSIQMFNDDGQKAFGQDFVIHFNPAMHYPIDLSTLAPGDYDIKLILYNYDTGRSVAGKAVATDSRFDRELDLGRLALE